MKIKWRWIVLYAGFILCSPVALASAETYQAVGREVLVELLPVWNRLKDLAVLIDSASSPDPAAGQLKQEVEKAISELDEHIVRLDATHGKEREVAKGISRDYPKADAELAPASKGGNKPRLDELDEVTSALDETSSRPKKAPAFKEDVATIAKTYAAREQEWRKKVVAILGRDDLPQVTVPRLTAEERAALYLKHLKRCESENAAERAEGARGIGAIGEGKGIPILLKMLSDPEEDVRIKAITSLAWLQAQEAVPVLAKSLAEDKSKWIKRRCAQALGQIGDKRVIPLLMKYMRNEDSYLAENSILALGWLQAKEAVPGLIEVLNEKKQFFPAGGDWREAVSPSASAAIALGYIGDKRAMQPLLEVYQMTFDDKTEQYKLCLRKAAGLALGLLAESEALPKLNTSGSWPWAVGSMDYSGYAAEMIKTGRKEYPAGIKQMEFTSHPSFYDFSQNTFMRTLVGYQFPVIQDMPFFYRIAESTGANMWRFIEARQPTRSCMEMRQRIGYLGNIGLKVQMLVDFNGGESKADFMRLFTLYGDLPAWQGVEQEELEFSLTRAWHTGKEMDERLKQYLFSKYTENKLKELGIEPEKVHILPLWDGHTYPREMPPVLFTEYNDMRDENYLEFFKEWGQFVHMLRRGTDCRCSFSQTYADGYPGRYWELSDVVDSCGPENAYFQVDQTAAFWIELGRNGAPRSSYVFWWPGLGPNDRVHSTEEHVEKGMASCLAHTQGVLLWGMSQYYYWASLGRTKTGYYYRNNKMDVIIRYLQLAGKLEPYLVKTRLATPIALLFSERTGRSPFYAYIDPYMYKNDYSNMQVDIWKKLLEAYIPAEPVIVETIAWNTGTAGRPAGSKLSPYKVCILADGRTLTEEEEEVIRGFVREGGVLVSDGSSTLYDRWGRKRPDYGLSDVFGVSYAKEKWNLKGGSVKKESATLQCAMPQSMEKTLLPSDVTVANYDSVKNNKGEVIAGFTNGDPAVIVNKFGKGFSVFFVRSLSRLDSAAWKDLIKLVLERADGT
ncbi:MAG: HEAT repeat domain-containing protein, partial [Kiritimatiellia bacterium]|nr:HEAT repeat domain-containing protein [Kiritimatiellia bacterium]